jgi:ABC-type transport system involved in cytochrome bd biosynthesis fused ATPase/permease subunit
MNPDAKVISDEQAFERIGAAVRLNLKQLEKNIEQAREESSQFFRLTLIFASVGFVVVIIGIILLFAEQVTAGIVSMVSSVIPEVTAFLFFTKDKELRKTISAYHQHMLDSQRLLTMIDVAETIKDATEKDRIKQQIIGKVLNFEPVRNDDQSTQ